MDRRDFIKTAAATTVVTSFGKKFAQARDAAIPMRELGRSGEKISMVGLGGYHVGMQSDEGGEGGIDLARGGGLQDRELHPLRARGFLHVSDHGLGIRIVRVHEQGDHPGLGNQLGQQL